MSASLEAGDKASFLGPQQISTPMMRSWPWNVVRLPLPLTLNMLPTLYTVGKSKYIVAHARRQDS